MDAVTQIHFIMLFTLFVLAFFIVSLILFIRVKKESRQNAGGYSGKKVRTKRVMLIVSSVLLAVTAAVYITVGVLLSIAIAYM